MRWDAFPAGRAFRVSPAGKPTDASQPITVSGRGAGGAKETHSAVLADGAQAFFSGLSVFVGGGPPAPVSASPPGSPLSRGNDSG